MTKNTAEYFSYNLPASGVLQQDVWVKDLGAHYYWDGSAWTARAASMLTTASGAINTSSGVGASVSTKALIMRTGSSSITGGDATKVVTFSDPMPDTSYIVVLTATSDQGGSRIWPGTLTTAGFTINILDVLVGALVVNWIAVAK